MPQQENGQAATISIHALLAESDTEVMEIGVRCPIFLSTLSLRRATDLEIIVPWFPEISIHALLAESDGRLPINDSITLQFLSTLSLRRATHKTYQQDANQAFLSTLSLRRATAGKGPTVKGYRNFYPRSPCGERPLFLPELKKLLLFLSTLSLRRATGLFLCL